MNSRPTQRLSDFKSEEGTLWWRHQDDAGIVFISGNAPNHREAFYAAACEPYNNCRAVILEVSEDKKYKDRLAFRQLWIDMSMAGEDPFFNDIDGATFFPNDINSAQRLIAPKELNIVKPQLTELGAMYCDIAKTDAALLFLVPSLRRGEGEQHEPHPCYVLNRVFLAAKQKQGTLVDINSGYVQPNEGDFLLMKPNCPHRIEIRTEENKDDDRLIVAASLPTYEQTMP